MLKVIKPGIKNSWLVKIEVNSRAWPTITGTPGGFSWRSSGNFLIISKQFCWKSCCIVSCWTGNDEEEKEGDEDGDDDLLKRSIGDGVSGL